MDIKTRKNHALQALGLTLSILYIFLYFESHKDILNYLLLPRFLLLLTAIFILYYFSLFCLGKHLFEDSGRTLLWILLFGFAFRLASFFSPLLLSDDLLYYIWHGRVAAHGLNPFLYSPDSPDLIFLRDTRIWQPIPFKDLPPAYPPFVMASFWLAYQVGGSSFFGFKLLQWIPEILTCLFGIRLLQAKGKNPAWILVYAWCPLPILEYIGMGHSDAWGVAFLCAFLFFFEKKRTFWAFAFLALASLVKWIPLLYLPLLWRYLDWRKRGLACVAFLLVFALAYAPFLSAGKNVFGLLPTYLKSWEFNASLYRYIRLGFERADTTHLIVSGLIAAWSLLVALKKPPLLQGLFAITFAFFLFFHTVYPWYLGWLLPFLLLENCWAAYAWLATSFLSYWVLIGYRTRGLWQESPWILFLEYAPVFSLLILQWMLQGKKKHPPEAGASIQALGGSQ